MSSVDPDYSLLRGPLVDADTVARPRVAIAHARRLDGTPPPRPQALARVSRVALPALAGAMAGWLVELDTLAAAVAAAAAVVALLVRPALAGRLDVASEVANVKRVGTVLLGLLLLTTLVEIVAVGEARAVFAVAVATAATLLLVVALQGLREPPRRVLLVGDRKAVQDLIRQWHHHPSVQIRGVCLDDESLAESSAAVDETAVMGSVEDVPLLAERFGIDQVVVAPGPHISAYDVRRLTWGLEHGTTSLAVAAEVHGATPHRIAPELIGRRLVLSVSSPRAGAVYRLVKPLVDRGVGAALLVLFAPVLLALALWVRLDSSGPALFRQTRTGLGGRAFTMYKLRTMQQGAERLVEDLRGQNEGAGLLFKLKDDPRITRVGAFLRRSSLDELPQLINVVKGEMSLIGPRPGLPSETDEYDDWIARRLRVKPGMTGLWQVSGRSKLGWHESVRLDLDYVDNQTLRDEFAIAYKTVRAVLQRDGAY